MTPTGQNPQDLSDVHPVEGQLGAAGVISWRCLVLRFQHWTLYYKNGTQVCPECNAIDGTDRRMLIRMCSSRMGLLFGLHRLFI